MTTEESNEVRKITELLLSKDRDEIMLGTQMRTNFRERMRKTPPNSGRTYSLLWLTWNLVEPVMHANAALQYRAGDWLTFDFTSDGKYQSKGIHLCDILEIFEPQYRNF